MTNGDRIRSMTDEEMATMLAALMSKQRNETLSRLAQSGVIQNISIVEVPILARAEHLKWLKEPVEEE